MVDGDIGIGRSTHALGAQGNDVWVANGDRTDLIDATTKHVRGSVELGLFPTGGAVGDDGTFWVTLVEG
jgi:hypothetical protein